MRWNLIAGLTNSAWSAIIALAVVPIYLKYLGIEAYGLIGFFVTMQSLMQLLDLGLSPTINREIARCTSNDSMQQGRNLLHSLALIYWSAGFCIAITIYMASSLIANHWIQSSSLDSETVQQAIILMGIIIGIRWPVGLYSGAFMGAQRLAISSGISIIIVTLSNIGSVVILAFLSPTIKAYFVWQVVVAMIYVFVMRLSAWHIVKRTVETHFDFDSLKRVWRFSAGLTGIAITGTLFMHMDKLILSNILQLSEYGLYMLASAIANSMYILISPTFNTIYPRFTHLVASNDTAGLERLYRTGTHLLGAIIFPAAMLLVVFSRDLATVWIGDEQMAQGVSKIVAFLVVGSALHGSMHFPYALQLSYGNTKLPFKINLILMIVFLPLIVVLATNLGAVGGALTWMILNIIYLFLGAWLTHRSLLKGLAGRWLLNDVGHPLFVSTIVATISYIIFNSDSISPIYNILAGMFLTLLTSMIIVATSTSSRVTFKAFFSRNIQPRPS